jgi:hypothetical protein
MKRPPSSAAPSPLATWHQFFKGRERAAGPRRTELGHRPGSNGFATTEWANTEWAETLWPEGGGDAPGESDEAGA